MMMRAMPGEGFGGSAREASVAPPGVPTHFTPHARLAEGLNLTDVPICRECNEPITERILHKIGHKFWHGVCLKCSACHNPLGEECFCRDGILFCQADFHREFGVKCQSCLEGLQSSALVMRAHQNIYHKECFRCNACDRMLNAGNEFYLQHDNQLVCRVCYHTAKQNSEKSNVKYTKPVLSFQQQDILQTAYKSNKNPTASQCKTMSREVGMSPNVMMTWFQNRRAEENGALQDVGPGRPEDPSMASCVRSDCLYQGKGGIALRRGHKELPSCRTQSSPVRSVPATGRRRAHEPSAVIHHRAQSSHVCRRWAANARGAIY